MAAYAALVSLMNIIDNLELHPRPPISLHKNQVLLLTQKVTFLQEFLKGYNLHQGYTAEADPLESRIADAAYAAEDVIESHIVDQIASEGENINTDALYEALEKVIQEMELIQKEAIEIEQTKHQINRKSTSPHSLRSCSIAEKRSMVGVDEVMLQLLHRLTDGRHNLQIIPIVGMGGSGKTTLAMNIYQDRLIKEHFHMCGWATISQEYSIPEILIQILRQLDQNIGQTLREDKIGETLYKRLFDEKYLIIIDDIWSIQAWDSIKRFLPNNQNGSRVVVTTRLSHLASDLSNFSLKISLLDEARSWDLLSKTVFGEKGCPLELEVIGKRIGKRCEGLPLSIVVVGGLLAKSKHTSESWKYIEENLNSVVNVEDDGHCLKILHRSYKQLPIYLKPCFLYMGIFPEDYVIHVSMLLKLWVVEGFLKPVNGKSLEELAKEYLMDLVGRNLILVHELGSNGSIKACKIHHLLRELCLREAQKERFTTIIPKAVVNGQRRIVISEKEHMNALSSMSLVRSLFYNPRSKDVRPVFSFRLLRLLVSLTYIPNAGEGFLENLQQLVNSRFLSFSKGLSIKFKFPSSVCCLFWNLQTIIVPTKFTAPSDIWYMPHIRHLKFSLLNLPDPPIGHDDIVLENLQTLVKLKNFKFSKQMVKRIPNIKKLAIAYDKRIEDDRYCLNNLDCLDKLESLKCSFYRGINLSGVVIDFPHSLKKLSLSIVRSQYWENILDMIGVLPLLQKLTLNGGRFKEGKWETSEAQFPSLKFLHMYDCQGIQVWTTECSHFPCLQFLRLSFLRKLKEIPLDFTDLTTLRQIHVYDCQKSVVFSALRILEEQEELYGEEEALQVEVVTKEKALERLESPNFRVTYIICMDP